MGNRIILAVMFTAFGLSACGGGGDTSVVSTVGTAAPALSADTGSSISALATNNSVGCSLSYDNSSSVETSGPDPLAVNLWHLKNIGQQNGIPGEDLNIEAAWALSLGTNVTIALVDDAFETLHPDLGKNINAALGLDYRWRLSNSALPSPGSGLPCNPNDNHGTSVAGIIGARYQNGIGGVGVAPNAKMVGYSAIETRFEDAAVDALTRDLQGNDIFNNSWGSPDSGDLWFAEDEYPLAIAKGISQGRQGRGAIYVFPSGNGGCALNDLQGGCQTELASYDGYLNEMGLIVVSALDNQGKRPSYSEPGVNVLVSAPGGSNVLGITTTSLGGKYSSNFVGTSAAAPMVSGVAALMLSANPRLTWRDVRLIFARTARQNDVTNTQWQAAAANGGYRFNPLYGFGAVDAHAAVKMAQSWQSLGGSANLLRCEIKLTNGNGIPDNGEPLTTTFSFDPSCAISAIEHLELGVDISHEYSGDIDIRLLSPSKTHSQFAETRFCGGRDRIKDECGPFEDWRAASVRHLDESARGTWRLEIRDRTPGKVGTLNTAQLVVYGR